MEQTESPREIFFRLMHEALVINKTTGTTRHRDLRRRALADISRRMAEAGLGPLDGRSPTRIYLPTKDGGEDYIDLDLHVPQKHEDKPQVANAGEVDDNERSGDADEFFNLP